jgi:hypothetical protein
MYKIRMELCIQFLYLKRKGISKHNYDFYFSTAVVTFYWRNIFITYSRIHIKYLLAIINNKIIGIIVPWWVILVYYTLAKQNYTLKPVYQRLAFFLLTIDYDLKNAILDIIHNTSPSQVQFVRSLRASLIVWHYLELIC